MQWITWRAELNHQSQSLYDFTGGHTKFLTLEHITCWVYPLNTQAVSMSNILITNAEMISTTDETLSSVRQQTLVRSITTKVPQESVDKIQLRSRDDTAQNERSGKVFLFKVGRSGNRNKNNFSTTGNQISLHTNRPGGAVVTLREYAVLLNVRRCSKRRHTQYFPVVADSVLASKQEIVEDSLYSWACGTCATQYWCTF